MHSTSSAVVHGRYRARLECSLAFLLFAFAALWGFTAQADVQWLLQQSQTNGSIAASADIANTPQSTAEAIRTLRLLGGGVNVAAAETFVLSQAYRGTEDLFRAITLHVDRGTAAAALVAELLTHQNADGGFGELPGYQSTALDTSLALKALARAGQLQTAQNLAALTYLISIQGVSGAWSPAANDPSIYISAHALEALWPFRQLFPAAASSAAKARTYLLAQRGVDHLWASDFESALSLIALAPMQVTQNELSASASALSSHQLPGGSWNGDVYTTALAMRAIAGANAPNANPDLARVSGSVIDGDTLVSLAGVTVRLGGNTRTTTAQGAFEFTELAAGNYALSVEPAGYPPLTAALNLKAGQTLDLGVLRLLRDARPTVARIEGHITDAAGADLPGVIVQASGAAAVQTDAAGRYLINDVPPGNLIVTASKPGYFAAQGTAVLLAGSTVNFSPALRAIQTTGFSVTGTFRSSATSQPLAGVQVTIQGSTQATAVSDAAGRVTIGDLPPGEVRIELALTGYGSRTLLATVNGGQALDISATLTPIPPAAPPTFRLSGRVTDLATGAPVAGAVVTVTASAGSTGTSSDASGTYELAGLAVGDFTVTVSAAGYQAASASATATSFQSIEFSPTLTTLDVQPTALHGIVVDEATGQPVEGASVAIVSEGGSASVVTSPAGEFLVRNLQSSQTTVTISATGYQARSLTLTPADGFVNDLGSLPIRSEVHPVAIVLGGRVVDSTNSGALAGVTITATTASGIQVVQSAGDGRFSLSLMSGEIADLDVSASEYQASTFTVVVAPETADLGQVRLRPTGLDTLLADLVVTIVDSSQVVSVRDTYQTSGSLAVHVHNRGYTAVPAGTELVAFEDRDRSGSLGAGDLELGRVALATELAAGERRSINLPVAGTTTFRDAPITVFADAANTVIERSEDNNVNASVGSCLAIPPSSSALMPVLKWRWAGSPQRPNENTVYGPVMVGQMSDDNGDGRIDARDVPDLVFSTEGQSLTVVSGNNGSTIWQSAPNTVTGYGSPALGDIDGDGLMEIVISNAPRTRLLAFEHDGTLKWNVPNAPTHSDQTRDGISIADVNADGVPEIITGRRVYSNTGALLWQGTGDHGGLLSYGTLPIAADINRDGRLEVIAGRTAYTANGAVLWNQTAAIGDGFNAIGNFDADEFPEIVLVSTARVYLLEHTGAIKWGPVMLSGANNRGGAPTVGDFDGDGQPEIGIAGASFYTVLETDGSLKWRRPTVDPSSSFTGSSLFDFDGDGRIEVVYADEQNLFIWDGATGNELFRLPNLSGTTLEYPVVADVDGDGRAELVVAANTGAQPGVRVFEGGQGEWMPTRAIWNQSTYHIDNINDDGSIPAVEAASWLTHNSYRANAAVQRQAEPVADLTAGSMTLIDRGIGVAPGLRVRIGNAGAPLEAGIASVAFYDGSPSAGGVLLGSVALPALASGAHVDAQLDGITAASAGGTLFAVADATNRVTECDEANNTSMTAARPPLGALSLSTAPEYAPGETVVIRKIVTNTGLFSHAYRVESVLRDPAGNVIVSLPTREVPTLARGAVNDTTFTAQFSDLLSGRYEIYGELVAIATGERVATAVVAFDIRHDPTQGPAASLRVSTGKPSYHTTDAVRIDTLSRNLTTTTLLRSVRLKLTVTAASGALVLDETFAVGEIVPGGRRELERSVMLVAAAQGSYNVVGTLLDAMSQELASATTTFTVSDVPIAAVSGAVTVGARTVEVGQALLCTRAVSNQGTSDLTAVGVRYLIVRIEDEALIDEQSVDLDLAAGGSRVDARTLATAGYVPGDYACTVQANLSGQWRDLAHAVFSVTAPAIRLEATLSSEGRGRLLVLMDEKGGWPCTPLREIELWTPFRTRLPADARIDVELLDAEGQRVDFESLALRQYRGTVNQRRGTRADLSIVGASPDVLTVKVENGAGLGEGYRIVATASAASLPPVVVESNVMGSSCGWHAGVGARFGDFHCSGGRTRFGGNLPAPLARLPTLAQQRAFLEDVLEENGGSYKIVTDDEAFERELRSGQYAQYALFSEHEKLDEQVQRELREAVYRGEGLLDAGQHDHRHHSFDEALGIVAIGRQLHARAVNLSASWSPIGNAALHAGSEALRIRLNGAQAIATYVSGRQANNAMAAGSDVSEQSDSTRGGGHNGGGHNSGNHDDCDHEGGGHNAMTAATSYTYGRGKSVYVGYDLLAEATHAGKDSLHAQLLVNALTHVAPELTTAYAGGVVPLRLTVQNRATATLGRALLPLPADVTLVDAGGADSANGTLNWPLDLSVNEQRQFTVWVRLPERAGPVALEARVQSGTDPNYIDQAQPTLTLNAIERASIGDARALAQTSIRFLLVKLWLDKAQFWLERDHPEFALASLVQASSEVIKVSHPQSQQLRWSIDDAIWTLSRTVE